MAEALGGFYGAVTGGSAKTPRIDYFCRDAQNGGRRRDIYNSTAGYRIEHVNARRKEKIMETDKDKKVVMSAAEARKFLIEHPDMPAQEVSEKTGRAVQTVKNVRVILKAKAAKAEEQKNVNADVKKDFEKLKTRSVDHALKLKNDHLMEMVAALQRENDAILGIKASIGPSILILPKAGVRSEGVSVSVASDWHVDEIVNPQKVNGRNKFNPDIATVRARKFFANTLKLINKEKVDIKIKRHILALLGDFWSGNIHEELLENTSMRPVEAAIFAQNLLVSGIEFLLANSSVKLIIPCSVGNHTRITQKVHISTETGNSMEYFMYHNLQNYFKAEPRVEFKISEGYHNILEVFGFKVRFHHGHAIRYNNGVGGIDVPVRRSIMQWNDKEQYADLDVFAHFHQYIPHKHYSVNGSLIGYSPFAVMNKYPFEVPCQSFFVLLDRRGKVAQFPIFLE